MMRAIGCVVCVFLAACGGSVHDAPAPARDACAELASLRADLLAAGCTDAALEPLHATGSATCGDVMASVRSCASNESCANNPICTGVTLRSIGFDAQQ